MPARKRSLRGLANWMTASTTPIFVVSDQRVVLVFNRGCEELTGWKAADVIGQRCEFVTEADEKNIEAITGFLCPPAEVFQGRTQVTLRPLVGRSGERRECRTSFFLLPEADEDGGQNRVLGIINEISGGGTVGQWGRGFLDPDSLHPSITPPVRPEHRWHAELARLSQQIRATYQLDRVVARTPEMVRALAQLKIARAHLDPVHFVGGPGTGKEYLARCLHNSAPDLSSRPFVPIDCRQLGHFELKRTLTRALDREHNPECPAGTLFLRNVSDLSRDLQDLVCATIANSPNHWRFLSSSRDGLETAVADDRCSAEFACRLTTLTLTISNLSDRGEELFLLAQQILEDLNRGQDRQVEQFSQTVLDLFAEYQWPDNLRELAAVVREARDHCRTNTIEPADLPFRFRTGLDAQHISPPFTRQLQTLDEYLAEIEAARIREALKATNGNKSDAADLLGIPRPKLYRRMESLGIRGDEGNGGQSDQDPKG